MKNLYLFILAFLTNIQLSATQTWGYFGIGANITVYTLKPFSGGLFVGDS